MKENIVGGKGGLAGRRRENQRRKLINSSCRQQQAKPNGGKDKFSGRILPSEIVFVLRHRMPARILPSEVVFVLQCRDTRPDSQASGRAKFTSACRRIRGYCIPKLMFTSLSSCLSMLPSSNTPWGTAGESREILPESIIFAKMKKMKK